MKYAFCSPEMMPIDSLRLVALKQGSNARSGFDYAICPSAPLAATKGRAVMTGRETGVIRFQCPRCGHELEQTIGNLRLSKSMRCPGCDVGINIDTDRLANAAEEIRRALEKVPPEITIKFFQ
jgi:predicted RNA-binding Zn-ribbon protein involved in translation (DUF1610 family)